ncbi:MAG: response regulator [Marinilabiliaceae bacterium]|nr:response regulator transcription factor [Bacteroidales bacterium]MDD5815918.1 response regulator transcription factor [Bacteroidales bacterium]MDY4520569.1 response regulator transcription factor [Bacteroidales bacterium]
MNIWLVDDHQLFRAGFKTLLCRLRDANVTFEANDGQEFIDHLYVAKPDVVFMDIAMPNMDGVVATERALAQWPEIKIIILSMFGEKEYYAKLVDIGIRGFLLKSCDFKEVEMALEAVKNGDYYFSQELLQQMVFQSSQGQPDNELSQREKDVLTQICNGDSNQEIAEKLFISKRTVEKHRANIMMKTGCGNTASLVVFAVKNGLYKIN